MDHILELLSIVVLATLRREFEYLAIHLATELGVSSETIRNALESYPGSHGLLDETPVFKCEEHAGLPLENGSCSGCAPAWDEKTRVFVQKCWAKGLCTYDYGLVVYKGAHAKVDIRCSKHGIFSQTPNNHLSNHGCPGCSWRAKKTTGSFAKDAIAVHGRYKYGYGRVIYDGTHNEVNIICISCTAKRLHVVIFRQTPHHHLEGSGCPKCSGTAKPTTEEFIEDAIRVHGPHRYGYRLVQYVGVHDKVKIICNACTASNPNGPVVVFRQTPGSHKKGSGCPRCVLAGYSKISIAWLALISRLAAIRIQHAENGGEVKVCLKDHELVAQRHPTFKRWFRLDGVHTETLTAFEFYGCYYHGCPDCYNPEDVNQTTKKSMGVLLEKTREREEVIREVGFSVITMWECEFRRMIADGLDPTTNQVLGDYFDALLRKPPFQNKHGAERKVDTEEAEERS